MLIAAEGKSSAKYNVGLFYERGMGVERFFKQASKWYTLAAMEGHDVVSQSLKGTYPEPIFENLLFYYGDRY